MSGRKVFYWLFGESYCVLIKFDNDCFSVHKGHVFYVVEDVKEGVFFVSSDGRILFGRDMANWVV